MKSRSWQAGQVRPGRQTWNILIVDDNSEDRVEVRRLLLSGSERRYKFLEADTGAAALRHLEPVDCVILDYVLPDMDAREVLAGLRHGREMTDAPIVVLTGMSGYEIASAVLRAGAMDYISKSWMNAESLTRSVENAVERFMLQRRTALHLAVSRFLATGQAAEDVLSKLLSMIGESLGWDFGAVWLPDRRGELLFCKELWHRRGTGLEPFAAASRMLSFTRGAGLPGRVWAEGNQPLWKPDAWQDDNSPRACLAVQARLFPALVFPIWLDGNRLGVAEFLSRAMQPPDGQLCDLLAGIFSQAGHLIERKRADEAMRASEERLRLFIENAPASVAMFDQKMRYLAMSRRWREDYNLSLEFIGRSYYDVFPEIPESWKEAHHRGLAGEVVSAEEDLFFRPDGTPRWLKWEVCPWRQPTGEIGGILIGAEDITPRVQAQRELRDRERRFRGIFDATFQYICLLHPDGTVLEVNRATLEAVSLAAKEVIGRPFWETPWWANLPDERARVHDAVRRAAAGEFVRFEVIYQLKDDREAMMDFSLSPVPDERGEVVLLVPEGRDITAMKRSEQALRASEERLRLSAQTAGFGIHDYTLADDCALWSDELYALTGVPPGTKIRLDTFLSLLHPEDSESISRAMLAAFEPGAGGDFAAEFRIIRPDTGETRWLYNRAKTFFAEVPGGAPVAIRTTGVVLDITERKRAEEAQQEAARRKDQFLAMLAHELRNPLAPIRNAVQLLRVAARHDPTLDSAGSIIERQVIHLARLVDDLLDVSRVSRGKITLKRERLDLSTVVKQAVETNQSLFTARRHTLSVTLPQKPVWVEGDLTRLSQVVNNLLHNAAKYTDEGGSIWLTLERIEAGGGAEAVIRVRDNGRGIEPTALGSVFELFYQVDSNLDRSEGGLGIGLSLVKNLVEMHGGRVEAHSAGRKKGSEFVVRLPCLPEAEAARPAEASASPTKEVHGLRILIVDDNRDAAESMAHLLEFEGHQALLAYDGKQAVEIALAERPAVILLDIGLPKLNGYEACRAMRQGGLVDTLIVAISGYGQEEDRRLSYEAGFDAHQVKPIELQTLRTLLGERQWVKPAESCLVR